MGLPLSITNSLKGSPLFKRITCTGNGILSSILHLYSELNSHQVRHLPQWERFRRPEWDSQRDGHSLFFKKFWSQKQRRKSYAEHQSTKGSWFPFASRSLEAPGEERPQPTPDHTGDLHDRCPNLDIKAEQWLFIASYNFVDVFFFIESLFSCCCPTWPSSSNAASIPVQAVLDPS